MKFSLILFFASWCSFGASSELQLNINPSSEPIARQRAAKQPWQPASYKGLTVGKSGQADVVSTFGKPQRIDFAEDEPGVDQVWYVYDHGGEFPGKFTVAIDKRSGLIASMFLTPEHVSKEAVIERFGKDFVLTRYDFCPGYEEAEAGPVFESEQGGAPYMEYRSKGIAILLDDSGTVYGINYLREPVGFSSERECQEAQAKRQVTSKKRKG